MSAVPIGGVASPLPPTAGPTASAPRTASTPYAAEAQRHGELQDAPPGKDQVRDAVRKIEDLVAPSAQDLRFSIDEDTGITVVRLIDTQTQTVLRQIPTQEVIEISKALDKLQGLLVKDKA